MVSVSTVQPSINLEFPCTYKNLKIAIYRFSYMNKIEGTPILKLAMVKR